MVGLTTLEQAALDLLAAQEPPLSERALEYNQPILTEHLRRAYRAFMDSELCQTLNDEPIVEDARSTAEDYA